MKYFCLVLAVLGPSSVNLMASGVIACYDGVNGDPSAIQRVGPCATQANFSTLAPNDSLDWSNLGSAATGPLGVSNTWNTSLGPWNAMTSGGITAGLTKGPGFTGGPTLGRVDNGFLYFNGTAWTQINASTQASMFGGHFDSIPDSTAGTPFGDHLVGFQAAQGPLLINFSMPINSVGFYISTKNSSTVDATIKAYDVLNPTTSTVPVLSYRVTDTAGGGANCAGLSLKPPVPCNDAPFLAIDALSNQFKSIVISTTDTNGFYIDQMYIAAAEEVPEPASALLIAGGIVLFGLVSRKLHTRS
jgi:hypothetical protein